MIELIYYANVRKPDPNKGTPGEMLPTFTIGLFSDLVDEDNMQATKDRITKEHMENMRTLSKEWRESLPEPRWIVEREHNICFDI